MPALDRALALAEGEDAALAVRKHLDLDVPRGNDRLLDIETRLSERSLRLGRGGLERGLELVGLPNEPHALPPATRDCLEQHGVAGVVRGGLSLVERRRRERAGHYGHPRSDHLLLRGGLVTHARHRLGSRAHEDEVVLRARLDECGVLREEAPAGVDGLGAGRRRGGDDRGNLEIALGGRRRADADGAVGESCVERSFISGRVDGHGLDPELVERADDADGDLAAVCDQDPVKGHPTGGRAGARGRREPGRTPPPGRSGRESFGRCPRSRP